MKSLSGLFIYSSFCFFLFVSCMIDFSVMPDDEVEPEKIEIAMQFADTYLSTLKNGETYIFSDEVVPKLKEGLKGDNQQQIYQGIKEKFGDYEKIEYAETWQKRSHPDVRIIRLKGTFTASEKKLEVRVVLNEENKIAGFWIKPWTKSFT